MKFQVSVLSLMVVLVTFVGAQNISNLLNNRRYVEKQIDCILDRGHCDVVGKKIKELLPEALYNNCLRCTPRQMARARTLIDFMQQSYPNEWQQITRHYAAMRYYRVNNWRHQ